MKLAMQFLMPVDLQIYFAYAMGLITKSDIMNASEHKHQATNDINILTKAYKQYKSETYKQYQSGNYVHSYIPYFERKFVKNNMHYSQVLPAMFAPVGMVCWWTKKVLEMSNIYIKKSEKLIKLPLINLCQAIGKFESHYRIWTHYVYVIFYC